MIRLIHNRGANALPGHRYQGGQFAVRNPNGSWSTFRYGDPSANCPDTMATALAKARACVASLATNAELSAREIAAALVTQGNREVLCVEQYLGECRRLGLDMTVARAYDDVRSAARAKESTP